MLLNGRNKGDTNRAIEADRQAHGRVGMKPPVLQHYRRRVLHAHLAVKHAPKRHTSDGLLAWHGTQGGGAVGVLTNLAQDATV